MVFILPTEIVSTTMFLYLTLELRWRFASALQDPIRRQLIPAQFLTLINISIVARS